MTVKIGIDIGQKRDHSAICIIEEDTREPNDEYHFLVRHLERLPLGTSYPVVADCIANAYDGVRKRTRENTYFYVNATGLGKPILDVIRRRLGVRLYGVYFTHGDRRIADGPTITLGKAYLVARLQTLLQLKRLHLPRNPDTEVLAQELLDYDIKVEPDANDRYGAFRVGTQDDLVTALGLAVQVDPIGKWKLTTIYHSC